MTFLSHFSCNWRQIRRFFTHSPSIHWGDHSTALEQKLDAHAPRSQQELTHFCVFSKQQQSYGIAITWKETQCRLSEPNSSPPPKKQVVWETTCTFHVGPDLLLGVGGFRECIELWTFNNWPLEGEEHQGVPQIIACALDATSLDRVGWQRVARVDMLVG